MFAIMHGFIPKEEIKDPGNFPRGPFFNLL